MTNLATLMGLAPLFFHPGAGTENYRGLGAIVLFGRGSAELDVLTFLPYLLVMVLSVRARLRR